MTVKRTTLSVSFISKDNHTLEELFLQLGLCDFDFDGLVNLLVMAALVVGVVLDGGGEEGVDKGGLSKARLASNLMILDDAHSQT
jgi:hypothetical protein